MSTNGDAPVIRLANVTKRFGREVALDGVSFDVPRGVVFALLGENGAGKTTTIRGRRVALHLDVITNGSAGAMGFEHVHVCRRDVRHS